MYSFFTYETPFSETDAMGVIHHSNHPKYFERGRIQLLKDLDVSYRKLADKGIHYPVLELQCTYKDVIKFDEVILVESRITEVTRTRLNFAYRIYTVEKMEPPRVYDQPFSGRKPKATGISRHCCIDDRGRPIKIDDELLANLTKAQVNE